MRPEEPESVVLGGRRFEVIKPARLREGKVLRSGDVFARVGPKEIALEEQIHTVSLYERGFPVPKVLDSGPYGENGWYYTETSIGELPFHKAFVRETREGGRVSDQTFTAYLDVVDTYLRVQMSAKNRTDISAAEFIETMLPDNRVLQHYTYFGHDPSPYLQAIKRAVARLSDAPMGILQYDLNPYNVMEHGIIDFELVGYGPLGYDALMSARWGGVWFTDYPSAHPAGYTIDDDQLKKNDQLVDELAKTQNLPAPTEWMEEFLLLKTAWATSGTNPPQPDWAADKLDFRRYRARLLELAVESYLAGQAIDYKSFPQVSTDNRAGLS